MEKKNDDSVKQKLLDLLAEEPPMVISTAYVYAKNFVLYGEDITKAWTTAVQQASILEQVKVKAKAEAYDYFKKDYEKCLKADMIAMLKELKYELYQALCHEIHGKEDCPCTNQTTSCLATFRVCDANSAIYNVIQEKINALKENEDAR